MKKAKWVALTVSLLLCVSLVAACNGTGGATTTTSSKATTTTGSTTKTAGTTTQGPSIPFAETFTFSMLAHKYYGDMNELTDVEKLVMEATNTDINITHVLATDYATKVNTILASGELPDVVNNYANAISVGAWARQGAIIPVDDLLAEYGQDILAKWGDTVLMAARNVEDGKIYSIYGVNDFTYGPGMMIRQDWLVELGLNMPVTIDDYITVLKAFRDEDPNGNGKKDEIPFFRYHSFNVWFYAYGIMAESPDQIKGSMTSGIYEVVDGKLAPFFLNARYQECLQTLSNMYTEKLIDREYLVRDDTSVNELVANGIFGSAYVWGGASISGFTKNVRETSDPEGNFVWAPPPQGPAGDAYTNARGPVGTAALISSQAKDPEKIMMVLNWYFTDQGKTTTNFGKEGVHYQITNGKPTLVEPYYEFGESRTAGMAANGNMLCWDGDAFMQCILLGQDFSNLDEMSQLSYDGYVMNEPYAYIFPSIGPIYNADLNIKKAPDVWVPLFTMQNQVIMGEKTFADMEALLAELGDDIAELTAQANDFYAIMTGSN